MRIRTSYIKRVVSYLVLAPRAFGPDGFNCVPGNLVPTRSNMPCCVLLAAQKTRNAFVKTVFNACERFDSASRRMDPSLVSHVCQMMFAPVTTIPDQPGLVSDGK